MIQNNVINTREWFGCLSPNEQLLWTGQPEKGITNNENEEAIAGIIVFISIGLVFTIVSICNENIVLSMVSFIFTAFISYIILSLNNEQTEDRRAMMSFAVTSHHILLKTNGVICLVSIAQLEEITLVPNKKGTSDIVFGLPKVHGYGKHRRVIVPPTFEAIKDGLAVYQLILHLQTLRVSTQ